MTSPDNRTPYVTGQPTPNVSGPENRSTAHTNVWPQPTAYTLPGPPVGGEFHPLAGVDGGHVPPTGPPAPEKRKTLRGVLVLAALLVAVIGIILAVQSGSDPTTSRPVAPVAAAAARGLTEQSAQRACRTAFESEWNQRLKTASAGQQDDTEILTTVQGIDMQETWKTDTGYNVNAVVRYTLTTGIIDPVVDTLNLTCEATGTDSDVATYVTNRS